MTTAWNPAGATPTDHIMSSHILPHSEFTSPNAAEKLAKHLLGERTAQNLKGFRMDYGYGEVLEFKRDCPGFRRACEWMAELISREARPVEFFRNGNGMLACKLVTGNR